MTKLFILMVALCVIAVILQLIGWTLVANIIYICLFVLVAIVTVIAIINLFKRKGKDGSRKGKQW